MQHNSCCTPTNAGMLASSSVQARSAARPTDVQGCDIARVQGASGGRTLGRSETGATFTCATQKAEVPGKSALALSTCEPARKPGTELVACGGGARLGQPLHQGSLVALAGRRPGDDDVEHLGAHGAGPLGARDKGHKALLELHAPAIHHLHAVRPSRSGLCDPGMARAL